MSAAANIINYYDPYDLNVSWRRHLLLYTAGRAKSTVISQAACNVVIRVTRGRERLFRCAAVCLCVVLRNSASLEIVIWRQR